MAKNYKSNKSPMNPEETKKRSFFFGTSPDIPRVVELEIQNINPNPDQPRKIFNEEKLRELASSIQRDGLLAPIIVRKQDDADGYVIVAGERRFRAHQMLGKETIFAFVTKSDNPDEIAVIENLQREDLNPFEEADALARLMERHGYTQEDLGQVIGKAQNTVSTTLRLNTLPATIKQEYPTSDTVSKSLLIEIARLSSEEEQLAMWEQVKQGTVTVRTARRAKQDGVAVRKLSPTEHMLSVGRSFARKLEKLDPQNLADNKAHYDELLSIHHKISQLVGQLQK